VRSIAFRTGYRVAETTDAGSFETFYRGQADRVFRSLAVALADPHLAREAADEAMTRAYAGWKRVGALDNPGGWVFRVGLNWATSRWRRLRRERPIPPESAADPGPSRAGVIAAQVALARLPLAYRTVIVCRVLLDLSTAETAAVLGLPEGTVKSRLARGLAALRAELTETESGRSVHP
jgi:DNA-directed RNA polymerase specialized sigma24 family protein